MKKLFFLMAAAAALFTSCSKDDTIGGLSRGKVTFEVSAPELATRYGEGTTATTLQYAVYDMVENTMVKTEKLPNKFSSGKASLSIDLVEGRTYEVAFWAESPSSPYSFNADYKTISYSTTTLTANNEHYDAFFAYVGDDQNEKFEVGQTVNVTLKRPFAQLNIATNDTVTAKDLDVEVVKTAVKVKAFTSFNLQTGAVEGNKTDVEFGLADQINGTLTSSSTEYDWLSMNYILTDGTNTDVTFTFTDDVNGTEEAYTRTYTAVPAKRNYRTNIIGSILTDPTVFELDIEEGFAGTEEYTVGDVHKASSASDIQKIINEAPDGTPTAIVLEGDIDLSDMSVNTENTSTQLTTRAEADPTLTIAAGKIITLDLNGKTLSATSSQTGKNYNMIDVNGGTLTVKNGTITTNHTGSNMENSNSTNVFNVTGGGVLNLDSVTAKNLGGSKMAFVAHLNNWGEVTLNVNNSTLESTYIAVRVFNSGNDMNNVTIKNSTLKGGNRALWVHNYTLVDFGNDATNTAAHQALLNFDIFNNAEQNSNNTFTVTDTEKSWRIIEYGFTNEINFDDQGRQIAVNKDMLQNALETAVDGTTIYIAADIEGDVVATQKEGVKITIEGQNKSYKGTITINGKSSDANTTAGLTIKNLSFDAESINSDACINLGKKGDNSTRYTCNVTVEGCTFDVPGAVGIKSYTGGDKNLIIKNCTATSNAHSLVQAKGIDPILVEGCEVYSKNGLNFNNSLNVTVDNCTVDVKGYAVRFGDDICGNGTIKNSSLKSANDDGDAVIVLRGKANDSSILNIINTKITGDPAITNSTTNAIVIIDGVPTVNSAAGLASVIAKNYTTINMTEGEYTVPDAAKGKTLTLNGQGGADKVVINVTGTGSGEGGGQLDPNFDGSTVTFNDLTIKTNSQLYAGFTRLSGTYNRCIIQNTYNLGTGNSAFYDCTINITNEYLRVGGASSAIFDGCTFNTDGRAILVFQDGTSVEQTVTVKDCTFNATAAANTWNGIHVAAVSIDGSQGGTYVVNLEGTNTVDSDFNGLWQIKAGEDNVTVNE